MAEVPLLVKKEVGPPPQKLNTNIAEANLRWGWGPYECQSRLRFLGAFEVRFNNKDL